MNGRSESEAQAPTISTGQYLLQLPYGLALSVTPMLALGATGAFLPSPYKEGMEWVSPALNLQWGKGTFHLMGHTEPLGYLRAEGHGWAILGFGKELARFVVGSLPNFAMGCAYGEILMHFGVELAKSSSPFLQAMSYAISEPAIRVPIIGVLSLLTYTGATQLIERIFPSTPIPYEADPELNIVQKLFPLLIMRSFNAIYFTESLHVILLAAKQDKIANHIAFVAVAGAMDQLVQWWWQFACVPHPLDRLVETDPWRHREKAPTQPAQLENGDEDDAVGYSACAITGSFFRYGLCTTAAVGAGGLVAYGLWAVVDKNVLLQNIERYASEMAVYMGNMMVEQVSMHAPRMIQSGSVCWANLFNKTKAKATTLIVEEDNENRNLLGH